MFDDIVCKCIDYILIFHAIDTCEGCFELPKTAVSLMLPCKHGEYKSLYLIEHTSCCCSPFCGKGVFSTSHNVKLPDVRVQYCHG